MRPRSATAGAHGVAKLQEYFAGDGPTSFDGDRVSLRLAPTEYPSRHLDCQREEVDSLLAPRTQYPPVAVPRISKEDLKQQLESGNPPMVVDARLKYPYEHSTMRLPGAVRYLRDSAAPAWPRERAIVVYDSDPNEIASTHVAAELIRQGYRATALKGGISEWIEAKLPTETKEAPMQAPPEPGALKG